MAEPQDACVLLRPRHCVTGCPPWPSMRREKREFHLLLGIKEVLPNRYDTSRSWSPAEPGGQVAAAAGFSLMEMAQLPTS